LTLELRNNTTYVPLIEFTSRGLIGALQIIPLATMSGPASPFFFSTPLRYLRWASVNKPAYFYSIVIGCAGPIMVLTVPPVRRYMGQEQRPKIPMTYPSTFCIGGEMELRDMGYRKG
jgi:hypothetical protein